MDPQLQLLYDYLVGRGSFVQLANFNPDYLSIFSRDVLKRIASQDEGWAETVPAQVADIIRQRGFFGYKAKESRRLQPTGKVSAIREFQFFVSSAINPRIWSSASTTTES